MEDGVMCMQCHKNIYKDSLVLVPIVREEGTKLLWVDI